ncbi:flavodoxin domain-containing protein [Ancrocorticia populi]|uniref:Flavodoxin-like domain-containing protein n=1 Tax=Ancrocorticia populi TaxID=2175228 RepID=A0A2V1K494_9ACTO|nr:flavodoxin domain-containing protein [Ancrocorticia populi]PWF24469.1 hypothetical protein DD236_10530 [Ancrocorticia populi]
MSTAIVYASKHGTTAEIARRMTTRIGGNTTLFDLADGSPDLSPYSTVVLGTAIYAGQPKSDMKAFCRTVKLSGKRLGLFVCGMEQDPAKQATELANAFPKHLRKQAATEAFLAGRFLFSAMNLAERFITKRIAKTSQDVDSIDDDAITAFASSLTGTE